MRMVSKSTLEYTQIISGVKSFFNTGNNLYIYLFLIVIG